MYQIIKIVKQIYFNRQPFTKLWKPQTFKNMKKLLILITALALSSTAFSQEKMEMKKGMKMGKMNHKMGMKKDHIMMMDGKMKMVKNGKEMPIENEMTMGDGTKVMADGMCTKKDGTTMTMKNGDMMDMDGKMGKMSKMGKNGKMGKMKM